MTLAEHKAKILEGFKVKFPVAIDYVDRDIYGGTGVMGDIENDNRTKRARAKLEAHLTFISQAIDSIAEETYKAVRLNRTDITGQESIFKKYEIAGEHSVIQSMEDKWKEFHG